MPHFTGACDYLSMLGLKYIHVSKRGYWCASPSIIQDSSHTDSCHTAMCLWYVLILWHTEVLQSITPWMTGFLWWKPRLWKHNKIYSNLENGLNMFRCHVIHRSLLFKALVSYKALGQQSLHRSTAYKWWTPMPFILYVQYDAYVFTCNKLIYYVRCS